MQVPCRPIDHAAHIGGAVDEPPQRRAFQHLGRVVTVMVAQIVGGRDFIGQFGLMPAGMDHAGPPFRITGVIGAEPPRQRLGLLRQLPQAAGGVGAHDLFQPLLPDVEASADLTAIAP